MTSSALPPARSEFIAWMVVGAWLLATTVALYLYPRSSGEPFETPARQFAPADGLRLEEWYRRRVSNAAPEAGVTLIHLFRPGCECNETAEKQLAGLVQRYRGKSVRFLATALQDGSGQAPLNLPLLQGAAAPPPAAVLNAAPAVFIFGGNGRLLYYGPYSDSAWCGDEASRLVDLALDRALTGRESPRPLAARGCFCS